MIEDKLLAYLSKVSARIEAIHYELQALKQEMEELQIATNAIKKLEARTIRESIE